MSDSPDRPSTEPSQPPALPARLRGLEIVRNPLLNKGTAFPDEAARRQIWTLDSQGLVALDRLAGLSEHKRPFADARAPLCPL